MWAWLRNTASRGRAPSPASFFRIRACSLCLMSSLVLLISISASVPGTTHEKAPAFPPPLLGPRRAGLAGLLLQDFARIAHALLLVGIGAAQVADLGGDLAHALAVDARHD